MYSRQYYYGNISEMGPFFIGLTVVCLLLIAFQLFLNWKLFEKHYGEKGYYGIIPFYNLYIFCKKTLGEKWYYYIIILLTGCIPFVGGIVVFIGSIWFNFRLAESLSRSKAFALGLCFIPIVFYPILVFSQDTKYIGPVDPMKF